MTYRPHVVEAADANLATYYRALRLVAALTPDTRPDRLTASSEQRKDAGQTPHAAVQVGARGSVRPPSRGRN